MTIKELEKELGIPRATVRFYEKEGLISPLRGDNSYREYSEEDVLTLRKIVILRKIGLSVSQISEALEGTVSLQELLEKNVIELQEKMNELEGAINLCKRMQVRQESMKSFDGELYWKEIQTEEKAGNRFLDILEDVIKYEKKVIYDEFAISDSEGNLAYGIKESILRALGTCIIIGFMWYILEGKERSYTHFLEGFCWPFVAIIIYSIVGLPVHFLEKKNPEAARKIRRVGKGICIVIAVIALVWVISLKVQGM